MTPMPPSCAMAIAVRDSVTVSIAALMSGMLRRIWRVSCVLQSASRGRKSDSAGTSSTSSKVSPSGMSYVNIVRTSDELRAERHMRAGPPAVQRMGLCRR